MNKFKRFCCIVSALLIASTVASCGHKERLPEDTPQGVLDVISKIEDNLSSAESSNVSSEDMSSNVVSDITSDNSSDVSSSTSAPENDVSSEVSTDVSDTHIHSFTETVILEPTCTENGKKEIVCECGYSAQEEILATGHKEAWVVVKNAEETAEGLEKAVCEVCGADLGEERAIPPIPATHTCTFVKGKTTAPTCTDKGYTIYSCSCGKSEKRDYTSALGHSWSDWETIKEPTTTSTGVEQRYCTRSGCDASETRELDKLPSNEDIYNVPATAENAHLVEERVLYYLNQYRISEGTAEATFLWNGKTYKYAKARAEQLVTNFAHDMDDIYAVATELEFGHYVAPFPDSYIDPDTGKIVYTGEMTDPYYSPGCSEAITGPYKTSESWTIDYLAKKVAANIYSSKTHWSYVGAETTIHITVGAYSTNPTSISNWYFCIATSSSDQYD